MFTIVGCLARVCRALVLKSSQVWTLSFKAVTPLLRALLAVEVRTSRARSEMASATTAKTIRVAVRTNNARRELRLRPRRLKVLEVGEDERVADAFMP